MQVARIHPVSSPADLKRLEAQAANSPEALGVIAIMDAADWKASHGQCMDTQHMQSVPTLTMAALRPVVQRPILDA